MVEIEAIAAAPPMQRMTTQARSSFISRRTLARKRPRFSAVAVFMWYSA